MRKEVRGTLKVNPTAAFAIVLGNWALRRGSPPDAEETNRLADLYAQEGQRWAALPAKPWWKRW
jgi:hypothetical protein